ncbi:hypothetical protein ABPG72_012152, partial [Tetrahymena utriculariae]
LIYKTYQKKYVIQSDRVLIKKESLISRQTTLDANNYKNFDVDISSGKFKNTPQIAFSLNAYQSGICSRHGFLITSINLSQIKLSYKLESLGCSLNELSFFILAIDDPNIEVQNKQLSTAAATTITGKKNILKIAAFAYGFQGNNGQSIKLKYTLTQIDNRNYNISFNNSGVPTVYFNFVLVYLDSSQDILQQLYSYEIDFDVSDQGMNGQSSVQWKTSTQIDSSDLFYGLKDFFFSSQNMNTFYLSIMGTQIPDAKNKQVILNYNSFQGAKVQMKNGIWMGFSLTTCQQGETMFLNSTYSACVKSCNSVDHHYTNNSKNTIFLYSSSIILCQKCNDNCFGCQDENPDVCSDCYNNMYLNPFTNTCDNQKPGSTFCQAQTANNQIYQNCQQCDSSCKECSSANNPTSCISCNLNSQNKYYYQNQCFPSQPSSTYCDSNFICQNCDPQCDTCSDSSINCQSCKTNSHLYQNKCLAKICSSNQYFNPYTNDCDQSQPSSTSCSQINLNGSIFYYCQKCDPSCKECDTTGDLNSCTSCDVSSPNKYYYNRQCLPTQPLSTFCDLNFQCQDCDKSCLSCSGSSKNCQSCENNIYFYQNQCYENPLPGTYCTSYTDCKQCDTSCKTCIQTSTNCTSCQEQQYLYNSSCLTQKPSGVYCEQKQNFFSCLACTNTLCQECQKNDLNKCISCPSEQFLYKDNCVQSQPDSTYCQDNKCYDCDTSCSSCNGPSNNNCTQCNPNQNRRLEGDQCACNQGYYEDNSKTCQQCFSTCLTCNGPTDKECLTCINYIYQNTCYDIPPPGTYCDSQTKQCQKCDQNCQACNGPNNNNCTQCDTNNGLKLTLLNTCACPDSQFIDNSTGSIVQCKNCDQSCKTCSGPNNNNCLSCTSFLFNDQCYDFQPPQTYCDAQKLCHQCSQGCNSCEDTKTCIDCIANFFLNSDNTCQKCYLNCLTCNGKNPNQCVTCQNYLILKSDNSCGCNSGYFIDISNKNSIECNKCDSTCLECQGSQPNQCLSCNQISANKYFYKNQCYDNQPQGAYCDPSSNICNDCSQNCIECSGFGQNLCTNCKIGYYLYNGQCYDQQPLSTYCDSKNVCHSCHQNCTSCEGSSNYCLSCQKDLFLFKNKCFTQKPKHTYCTPFN